MSTAAPAAPVFTPSDLNSDAEFGARMRHRLAEMLANPWTFLPSYKDRYEALMRHAATLTPHQSYAMTMLLGKDSTRGYPDMPNTAALQFPRVNRVDAESQFGWYYFAGVATGMDGREYGVLCMYFRYSLLPPPMARQLGLTDEQNQIIDLQLSVAVDGGAFHQVDPVVTAGTGGRVDISDELFLKADGGSVEALEPGKPFPLRLRARGTDVGEAEPVELEIDFTFGSSRGYLLQGWDGAEPLVGGIGTRYYSIPGLALDPSASTLRIGGSAVPLAKGTFWFDHQWGVGLAPSGAPRPEVMRASANLQPPQGQGWDFFALNLDGPVAFTFNSLHDQSSLPFMRQTGPTPPGVMTSPVVGKYMDPAGTVFNVSGTLRIARWRKTDHTPNAARYPNTPTWVPHGWEFTLTEAVVPERLRRMTLEALQDGANTLFFANGSQYVEAAVRVRDAGGEAVGHGFAEATAYADNLHNVMHLAGVPAELEPLFRADPPSLLMKVLSGLYMLNPGNQATLKKLIACGSFPPPARPTDCA
jgi:predicted secreted hydrolase